MKLSERMHTMATKKRFRPPAIWSILKDYSLEVAELEIANAELLEALEAMVQHIAPEPFGKASRLANSKNRIAWLWELGRLRRSAEELIRKHKGA